MSKHDERDKGENPVSGQFANQQVNELFNARLRFPNIVSAHEGYAIIKEEVDELWEIVKKKSEVRSKAQMLEELLHVAAMAQRMAEDLNLLSDNYGPLYDVIVIPEQQSRTVVG